MKLIKQIQIFTTSYNVNDAQYLHKNGRYKYTLANFLKEISYKMSQIMLHTSQHNIKWTEKVEIVSAQSTSSLLSNSYSSRAAPEMHVASGKWLFICGVSTTLPISPTETLAGFHSGVHWFLIYLLTVSG